MESEATLDPRNTVFGRAEVVQKTAEHLVVDEPFTAPGGSPLPLFPSDRVFNVGAAQIGYIREITRLHWSTLGIGASGTVNFLPAALERATEAGLRSGCSCSFACGRITCSRKRLHRCECETGVARRMGLAGSRHAQLLAELVW